MVTISCGCLTIRDCCGCLLHETQSTCDVPNYRHIYTDQISDLSVIGWQRVGRNPLKISPIGRFVVWFALKHGRALRPSLITPAWSSMAPTIMRHATHSSWPLSGTRYFYLCHSKCCWIGIGKRMTKNVSILVLSFERWKTKANLCLLRRYVNWKGN